VSLLFLFPQFVSLEYTYPISTNVTLRQYLTPQKPCFFRNFPTLSTSQFVPVISKTRILCSIARLWIPLHSLPYCHSTHPFYHINLISSALTQFCLSSKQYNNTFIQHKLYNLIKKWFWKFLLAIVLWQGTLSVFLF